MKTDVTDDLPSIEEVLRDPAASLWLRNALRAALVSDPVDAANDAEILARLLDRRCRSMISQFDEDERPS